MPLLLAFYLARCPANRRYTYGYHRAEDIAGVFIVLSIAFSAAYILWESVQKLLNPQPLDNLSWVAPGIATDGAQERSEAVLPGSLSTILVFLLSLSDRAVCVPPTG